MRLHGDAYFFMKRQFMYFGAGLAVAALAAWFDYRAWRDHWILAILFYTTVFVLLWMVFGFRPINGSYRWIAFGPLRLQPSEFAKPAIVILLAAWLDKSGWRVELFMRGAFWPAVLIGVIAFPILLEPDFGSVMVVSLAGFLVMFVAGVRVLHLLPFFLAGFGIVGYKVMTNANRMARLVSFVGGFADGLFGRAAAGAGDAGRDHAPVGPEAPADAEGHRLRAFRAYRALRCQDFLRDAEFAMLHLVRVGDDAAGVAFRDAGDVRERGGDETARARLRRGDRLAAPEQFGH